MTIKIISCAKPHYWYADHIGEIYAGCVPEKMHGQLTGKMLIPAIARFVFAGDYEIENKPKSTPSLTPTLF